METNEKLLNAIYDAFDDVNATLPDEKKLRKIKEEKLFGKEGRLDSIGFINFIVSLERKIETEFGITLSLADDEIILKNDTPFTTAEMLVPSLMTLMSEQKSSRSTAS